MFLFFLDVCDAALGCHQVCNENHLNAALRVFISSLSQSCLSLFLLVLESIYKCLSVSISSLLYWLCLCQLVCLWCRDFITRFFLSLSEIVPAWMLKFPFLLGCQGVSSFIISWLEVISATLVLFWCLWCRTFISPCSPLISVMQNFYHLLLSSSYDLKFPFLLGCLGCSAVLGCSVFLSFFISWLKVKCSPFSLFISLIGFHNTDGEVSIGFPLSVKVAFNLQVNIGM